MKYHATRRGHAFEPFIAVVGDKKISDIVITNHAKSRWSDRVESGKTGYEDIAAFLREKLRTGRIESYYRNEEDVYLIDDDLVMVCEFAPSDKQDGQDRLYKMIVITFLGRMSETIELRDLKSYYSWLRHSRRMTLIKNSRKRK